MSEAEILRRQVREEILRTAGPVLTIRGEGGFAGARTS